MIEQFFRRAAAIEQHRNALVVGPYLDGVVAALADNGYARASVRRYIYACEAFGRFLAAYGVELQDLSEAHVEAFLHEVANGRTWRGVPVDPAGAVHGRRRPLELLLARLRSAGVVGAALTDAPGVELPQHALLVGYLDFLRQHRGLGEATIGQHALHVGRFLRYLGDGATMGALTSRELDGFVVECGRWMSRRSIGRVSAALRGFLRIPRAKGRAASWYPLHPDAGAALVDYLRRGRPDSACGQVFLTVSAPARPFARSSGISNVVARHLAVRRDRGASLGSPHAPPLAGGPPARGWLLSDRNRRSVRPPPPPVDLRLREGGPRRPAGRRARGHGARLVTARFASALGPHLVAYLGLMRAVGRRYERVEPILRNLDRFAAAEPAGEVVVTREFLGRWLASAPHLAPGTLRAHASAARGFCRYLARAEPRTEIPDRSLAPARLPQVRPHVFDSAELRALVAAAGRLPATRWPLAPTTIRTLLLLLYASGLRVGEALGLTMRDVDLDAGPLFVAETKFFKSRWVPVSASLAAELATYLAARTAAVGPARPDDPLFINSRGTRCSYSRIWRLFRGLVRDAGIDAATRGGRVRLHHLRHTFAIHCVLRWYREGSDVGARLPLLATYLGHASVLATHVYVAATPELLGAASERFERAYGALVRTPDEEPWE